MAGSGKLSGRERERAHLDTLYCSLPQHRPSAFERERNRRQHRAEAMAPTSQPSEAFAQTWRNSQGEQVREALGGLPQAQHKVLELAYFSSYTHIEIAELLELPLGTVKGRVRLGLKKLREHFEPRGMVEAGATSEP